MLAKATPSISRWPNSVRARIEARQRADRHFALRRTLEVIAVAEGLDASDRKCFSRAAVRAVMTTSMGRRRRRALLFWVFVVSSTAAVVALPFILSRGPYTQPSLYEFFGGPTSRLPLNGSQVAILSLLGLFGVAYILSVWASEYGIGPLGPESPVTEYLSHMPHVPYVLAIVVCQFLLTSAQTPQPSPLDPILLPELTPWERTIAAPLAWGPAILTAAAPLIIGSFAVAMTAFISSRWKGGDGVPRVGDTTLLSIVDLIREVRACRETWGQPGVRRRLTRAIARRASSAELDMLAELRSVAGRRNARQPELVDRVRSVAVAMRASLLEVALSADSDALHQVEVEYGRIGAALANGNWESFKNSPLPSGPSWWRRHTLRFLIGLALVAVCLPPLDELLINYGLASQRPAILFAGFTLLLSLDNSTYSRIRDAFNPA